MKIRIGPVEVEQNPIQDETLFNEYKESPEVVEKYLVEKSKFLDLTLKNTIAGKTMKMIRDFFYTLVGSVAFIGWAVYVFYVSKDAFVWEEMSPETAISVFLQALLVIFICFLPVMIITGLVKAASKISSLRNKVK